MLVSCDLLGFSVEQTDGLRRALSQRFGVPTEGILLACTHTHTGPATVPLRGCGEPSPDYVAGLSSRLEAAVVLAETDAQPARLVYAMPTIEPIGYNRRQRRFEPIDPVLKTAFFLRECGPIAMTSYACHPVTLGPAASVSADWPGAVVRAFEKRGYQAIVFQGFCGDIDPVTNLDRWGQGTEEDLALYGELLCQRALASQSRGRAETRPALAFAEQRIDLPLDVPSNLGELDKMADDWAKELGEARCVARDWLIAARERYPAARAAPHVPSVPVHALRVGGLRLVGLPGEVFAEYSLQLRSRRPDLITIGYAGGGVGYVPTAEAFVSAGDYACYCAPRLYQEFPFHRDIESVVLSACERVLGEVDRAVSATDLTAAERTGANP